MINKFEDTSEKFKDIDWDKLPEKCFIDDRRASYIYWWDEDSNYHSIELPEKLTKMLYKFAASCSENARFKSLGYPD